MVKGNSQGNKNIVNWEINRYTHTNLPTDIWKLFWLEVFLRNTPFFLRAVGGLAVML